MASPQDKQVAASLDDSEERNDGWNGPTQATAIVGTRWGSTWAAAGFRFTDVTIPAGATITTAYVSYYPHVSDSDTCNTTHKAEDSANPPAFATGSNNITNRTLTTAGVTGDMASWTAGTWVDGPEIKDVIQELVDSYDYSSGAPMVIINTYNSGTGDGRVAKTWDADSALGAKLHIEYTIAARIPRHGFTNFQVPGIV